MGRWAFDEKYLEKFEELSTTCIHTCKAVLLRLMAMQSHIEKVDVNQQESLGVKIDATLNNLEALDASAANMASIHSQEAQVWKQFDQDLDSFKLRSAEEQQAMTKAKEKDENAIRVLSETPLSSQIYKKSPREATITFSIRELGKNEEWRQISNYPATRTLAELADRLSSTGPQIENEPKYDGFPEFWREKHDSSVNCISTSGIYWEWQPWDTKVAEAALEGIEVVTIDGDYVVIVLLKDEMESGMPVDLVPKPPRRSARQHIEDKFKHEGRRVKSVQCPKSRRDASEDPFDKLGFSKKATALYVEVIPASDQVVKCIQEGTPTTSKGKKRECSGITNQGGPEILVTATSRTW